MIKSNSIFSLHGRTVLLTGATGYLGRQMAFALAEHGAVVLINSRSPERCNALVEELVFQGFKAESAVFDVTSSQEISDFFAGRAGLPLHCLVNNAYFGTAGSLKLSGAQAYIESYDVCVVSAHKLLQGALPGLRLAVAMDGDATVISIASMYGMVSPDQRVYDSEAAANPPFYGAAKAALLQWSRYAACELGCENIRVNTITPGPFPSDAVQQKNPEFVDRLAEKVPLGRVGKSQEIQGPLVFLASPASTFVNGANVVVDGGWTAW